MTASPDQLALEDLEKLLTQARSARGRFEPTWYLNVAYFMGDQWLFWNRGRLDRPRLEPYRITLTDNRIIGIVRTELSKMTKQKPAPTVVPVTADDADLEAARTGEKILDYLWRHLRLRMRLMDSLRWSRTAGAGFWKVFWDSAKGQQVTIVVDGEGTPVMHSETGGPMRPHDFGEQIPEGLQTKTIFTGDVNIESVSPFEMYFDPIALEVEDAEWCVQVAVKSPEYVKAHFGKTLEPDTDVASGTAEGKLFAGTGGGSSSYRGIKINEYWSRPSSRFPNGRRVVWAKGKVLLQEDNPYRRLPYVMFKGIEVPGRFWPTSVVEQLRGPQTELNKNRSQVTENAQRVGNPALLAAKQADVQYEGVPGERIDYDDTVPNALPSYLQPPQMPAYVLQQQERIEQSMQDISGQHEVSSAQVPTGVTAASAINLLQEADDTRLGPAIYDMEETLGIAFSWLLELVARYWTDERTVMIGGEDGAWDVMQFRGAALRENTHVEVQAGSAFPRSKAAKQAAIQEVLNLALQYSGQALNPRDLRKVLRDYEVGGLEKLFGDLTADEAQVSRENQQIVQGARLSVNAYDNHQAHIDSHTEFQKGAVYCKLEPPTQEAMELHVAEHRARLLQALGPPQLGPGAPEAPGPQGAPAAPAGPPAGPAGAPSPGPSGPQGPQPAPTP